ncbi:hypothetical protein ma81 [Moumouvirus australiensis]|uniref:Uncharacterized protein n=1 Tax=Moumouvirus australiensis TaxID=2109587 RepID=A0A2P1EKQ2_9VIRU|nr:hypothetical protein QKC55_gp822 [Moumouvirus australiensis]AVL94468.1 hypothetical protein ma81 [Moumouvirus australiensis]
MNNARANFNAGIRFPEGDVYHTVLPTRGFKKLTCYRNAENKYKFPAIATLIIPPKSTIVRPNYADGKSRTDEARVESIETLSGKMVPDDFVCHSPTHGKMIYKVGSVVKPKEDLDTNVHEICTSGIHFFFYKKEAADYYC